MVSNSLIVLGNACVDFQGEQLGSSLQDMLSFRKYVGQAAAFALGFQRLGLKTALASHVGEDAMGSFIVDTLQQEKIDVSQIKIHKNIPTTIRLDDENYGIAQHGEIELDPNVPASALFLISDSYISEQTLRRAKEKNTKIILYWDKALPIPSWQSLCDLVLTKELFEEMSFSASTMGAYAFMIGYTSGWLHKVAKEQCLKMAVACHDIVQQTADNSQSLPSLETLSHYLSGKKSLAHLQYVNTRPEETTPYFVFNLDQNQPWQKVPALQAAIIKGLEMAFDSSQPLFLITDAPTVANAHIVRPIEEPGIIPLQFRGQPDITQTLRSWPKDHRAKVTVVYHPDDRFILKGQQEHTLDYLYKACRATHHELWIEITPSANSLITSGTMAHVIRRFYEIGIYPDIWQLPPPRDQRSWDSLTQVIAEYDPHCRGVLVSAQHALIEQLPLMFASTNNQKYSKGFVVNGSIFQKQLEAWQNQQLPIEDLPEVIAGLFKKVMSSWQPTASLTSSFSEC